MGKKTMAQKVMPKKKNVAPVGVPVVWHRVYLDYSDRPEEFVKPASEGVDPNQLALPL